MTEDEDDGPDWRASLGSSDGSTKRRTEEVDTSILDPVVDDLEPVEPVWQVDKSGAGAEVHHETLFLFDHAWIEAYATDEYNVYSERGHPEYLWGFPKGAYSRVAGEFAGTGRHDETGQPTPFDSFLVGQEQVLIWDNSVIGAIDIRTGQDCWTHDIGEYISWCKSVPAVDRVVVRTKQALFGLDERTGELVWERSVPHGDRHTRPKITDSTVIDIDGESVIAQDVSDGSVRWRKETDAVLCTAQAGSIYIRHDVEGECLTRLSAADGTVEWRCPLTDTEPKRSDDGKVISRSPSEPRLSFRGDYCFIRDGETLRVLDATSGDQLSQFQILDQMVQATETHVLFVTEDEIEDDDEDDDSESDEAGWGMSQSHHRLERTFEVYDVETENQVFTTTVETDEPSLRKTASNAMAALCDEKLFLVTVSGITVYTLDSSQATAHYDFVDTDTGRRQRSPRIVRVEEMVYISAGQDGLLCLAPSGEIEWYSEIGGGVLLDDEIQPSAIYVDTDEDLLPCFAA
ncbi:PQQ-binding-like beta-propeller repeat protein [Halorubrum pallidum]|uniref:PQQ-binding-like beta-propeller repeat protein n=1 Tax=Halorubrum pallidum TaxID=1526114 RepID=A0ABD5T0L3_9EURY